MKTNLKGKRLGSPQPETTRISGNGLRPDGVIPIEQNGAHNRDDRISLMTEEKQQLGTPIEIRTRPIDPSRLLHHPARCQTDGL